MKVNFDSVAFQRRVRRKLTEEYRADPKKFRVRLKKAVQSKASSKIKS